MKSKKVTVTKRYIEDLKNKIKKLEQDLDSERNDVRLFREFFLSLLKEFVKMASKNEYYSAETMINKLSKLLNSVRSWYW